MGFKNGAYATVWETKPVSNSVTEVRLSTNKKNKDGSYEQDFSGFVRFVGADVAQRALSLKSKDRIKLDSVEVTNRYDKDKKITYTNCAAFGFELANQNGNSGGNRSTASAPVESNPVESAGYDLPF